MLSCAARATEPLVYVCIALALVGAPQLATSDDARLPATTTAEPPVSAPATSPAPAAQRPVVLIPLYASFASLEALDVVSTLHAFDAGTGEGNPLLATVRSPAALAAIKGASAAGLIWATERLRREHPIAAVVVMVAANSALATVVV